jgi:hypothetical protein
LFLSDEDVRRNGTFVPADKYVRRKDQLFLSDEYVRREGTLVPV